MLQDLLMLKNGVLIPTLSTIFTTPGTYSIIVPDDVEYISALGIGAGGGGSAHDDYNSGARNGSAGAGGALAYQNNIAVSSGDVIQIIVGAGGVGGSKPNAATSFTGSGGVSGGATTVKINGIVLLTAGGGTGGQKRTGALYTSPSPGGTFSVRYSSNGGGGNGGNGGGGTGASYGSGGGGCGGFGGIGGTGYGTKSNLATLYAATNGVNGSGAGSNTGYSTKKGGGVSLNGYSGSGVVGSNNGNALSSVINDLYFGGGGDSAPSYLSNGYNGANGAVKIVWPGNTRLFPNTNIVMP